MDARTEINAKFRDRHARDILNNRTGPGAARRGGARRENEALVEWIAGAERRSAQICYPCCGESSGLRFGNGGLSVHVTRAAAASVVTTAAAGGYDQRHIDGHRRSALCGYVNLSAIASRRHARRIHRSSDASGSSESTCSTGRRNAQPGVGFLGGVGG